MEDLDSFAVAWYPGEFGNLLRTAIYLQKTDDHKDYMLSDSKDESNYFESEQVKAFHSDEILTKHSELLKHSTIFISTKKKYFDFFGDYIYYRKTYQRQDTFEFLKDNIFTFWNRKRFIPNTSHFVDFVDLFENRQKLFSDLEKIFGAKLKTNVKLFLDNKSQTNLDYYLDFKNKVVDNLCHVSDFSDQSPISSLELYDLSYLVLTYIHHNPNSYTEFARHFPKDGKDFSYKDIGTLLG